MKNTINRRKKAPRTLRRSHGATGTTLLDTRGLRPGVYYYTQWSGAVKGERGTLLVQP